MSLIKIGFGIGVRSGGAQTDVLWINNSSAALTGTLVETKVASFLIPANMIGANDVVEILSFTTKVGSAGACSTRCYFNTSDAIGGTQVSLGSMTSVQFWIGNIRRGVCKNSVSAQVWFDAVTNVPDDMAASTASKDSTAINFAVNQYLVVSLQNGNSADTSTLESVTLRIIRQ